MVITCCDACPCTGEYGCRFNYTQEYDPAERPVGVDTEWLEWSTNCRLKQIETEDRIFIPERINYIPDAGNMV